ncbi:hypothetical protein GCM10010954_01730 [Halobacillus andaensis]|uniref:Morphogenetic protein associated with SpoVID n=1 Tax=Halobacillus andaensis TaxID=1176239 RepID=A0A917AYD4_HALAA|nr:SafA/ExsA family spore coat assembly protein [Halobacillus andaensis]MBP2002962.1 morphogenetic protein associated with SpoVID [Halobacillus andaensis]GGF06925.1 hypothetical protein GCM10010954_01730 [Halobacillus andaensis]
MRIHVVQKGDTLWKISKKYGVDFEELKSVNSQLSNPDMIMPGMKIKVPQGKKQVKKEAPKKEAPKKEMPMKEMPKKEMPKKEMPKPKPVPKPMPQIKEDEKMPKPAPIMEKPMMPIQMNMPIQMPMDQHMQNYYTTFHLPQMPMPEKEKPKGKVKGKAKEQVKAKQVKEAYEESAEFYQPKHENQPHAQALPYCPPMHMPYHPSPWDYFWCPPYPVMGMHHQPMNQPMHYPMPNHPMGNQPMPYVQGMQNEESSSEYMMGEGEGGCGCGAKKPMNEYMSFENQPNPQMMAPNMNGWYPHPMMNGNDQMRGFFAQPVQQPPLNNWQENEPWQDDDGDDT